MKNRQEGDILKEFLRVTNAEPVIPTEEDEIERLEFEAEKEEYRLIAERLRALQAQREAEEEAVNAAKAKIRGSTAK